MKKMFTLIIVLGFVTIQTAQTVTGNLVDQNGYGLSGLQLSLYINPKIYFSISNSDGSFSFNNITDVKKGDEIPTGYAVANNYPNPFNPKTRIAVTLPIGGRVNVEVFNLLGKRVIEEIDRYYGAGISSIDLELNGLPNGIYFARISLDGKYTVVRKLMLLYGSQHLSTSNFGPVSRQNKITHDDQLALDTKIDSLVVVGSAIGIKVFNNLPSMVGSFLNLGNLIIELATQGTTLSLPPNSAAEVSLQPTLSWNTTSGATSYKLQVATDNLFSSYVYNQSNITNTSQQVTGLTHSTNYYWRVIAANTSGVLSTSLVWMFTTHSLGSVLDFTKYAALGDSYTAGYQDGALYESGQIYSYPNLIAKQTGISLQMPIYSDPGTGGRLELTNMDFTNNPPTPNITVNSGTGVPTNLTYAAPYNNLGIPGALLYDVLNATNSADCFASFSGKTNSMFDLILRNSSLHLGSQFAQAKVKQPSIVTLWIGSNDLLGFATGAGFSPTAPTSATVFDALYRSLADSLKSLNTKVVVANIPDITTIPFFTTIGANVALNIGWKAKGIYGLYYQKHGATAYDPTAVVDSVGLLTGKVDLILPAGNFTKFLGDMTGAAWTAIAAYLKTPIAYVKPAFADVTKPFGFHPLNPFPDVLTLDVAEITTAKTATQNFNNSIDSIARNRNFGLVDINAVFGQIRAKDFTGGTDYNGILFMTSYISGGLFSLDAVHPSKRGYGIIANEFIKVINAKFNGSISLIDISTIPPLY